MKIKSQKGSITIFVLIALLFFTTALLLMYVSSINGIRTVEEKSKILKEIYEKNTNSIEEVYLRALAKSDNTVPSIGNIPDIIVTNVTELNESYIKYGIMGGITTCSIFNENFESLEDVIDYAIDNSNYGTYELKIRAFGKNGKENNFKKNIEIIKGMKVTNEQELNTALTSGESLYISVSNDIDCANTKELNNVAHRLDLNSHSITYTKPNESFSFLTIGSNGNLTILDSSNQKQGSIIGKILETDSANNGTDRENKIYTIENNGTLLLQSGKIMSDYFQHLNNARDSIHARGTAVAVKNNGTTTVSGAQIESKVSTNGISYGGTRDSKAIGVGISNTGTVNLNTGNITVTADAYMQRQGLVYGETVAYAYGVYNDNGTVNRLNSFLITVSATAHKKDYIDENKTTTYKETQDQSEIKQK